MTIKVLTILTDNFPELKDFIYVFDYTSKDTFQMKILFDVSDAVIVWGGDEAISSIRKILKPNTKIIEWGHKISFAYATKDGITKKNLEDLAEHIIKTNQLLCSSCQCIYLDTDSHDDLVNFSEEFIVFLEKQYIKCNKNLDMGIKAQIKLKLLTEELNSIYDNKIEIINSENCSLIISENNTLETSIMFGNCLVKKLAKKDIIKSLRHYKNYLQTVGLVCTTEEKNELFDIFLKIGITKVANPLDMSTVNNFDSHDGDYPLRRYTKIVSLY